LMGGSKIKGEMHVRRDIVADEIIPLKREHCKKKGQIPRSKLMMFKSS